MEEIPPPPVYFRRKPVIVQYIEEILAWMIVSGYFIGWLLFLLGIVSSPRIGGGLVFDPISFLAALAVGAYIGLLIGVVISFINNGIINRRATLWDRCVIGFLTFCVVFPHAIIVIQVIDLW